MKNLDETADDRKYFEQLSPPFVIAANGRSGSYFLMSLLNSTKKVGRLGEQVGGIIKDGYNADSPDSVLLSSFKKVYENATIIPNPTGIWGTKVDISQLFVFKRFLDLCNLQPKEIKWIWLSRKNKFLQAISFFRADSTGIWHLAEKDKEEVREHARSEIDITVPDILERAAKIYLADLLWDCFFIENEIIPHKIYYEDFIDPVTWDSTVADIFDFLNVDYKLPLGVSTNRLKIATDKKHEEYERILGIINKQNIPVKLDSKLL